VFASSAALAWILDAPLLSYLLIVFLVAAATLESMFAVCLGCIVYNAIWGCAECADLTVATSSNESSAQEDSGVPAMS
jgi:hypothetical protein